MKRARIIQFELSHLSFSMIFTTLLYITCNTLNYEKIVKWFHLGDSIDYTGLSAYLIFGLCLFMAIFILFAHRWTIKPVAILLVIISAATTYFISKYNVAIDRTMLMNTIHTDVTEVRGLLSIHMLPYVLFLIIVPVALILSINITFNSPVKYLSASVLLFVLALGIGVGLVYLKFDSIHRATNLSKKYILHSLVPINSIMSISSVIERSIRPYFSKKKAETVISGYVSAQDDLLVVLAIGETSRQKSFSLYGYDRKNTNPVLSKINDLHILNGKARLGSTLFALDEILEKDDIKLPAITSKVGIDTSCLVNYTLYDNCDSVGEIKVDNCGHGGKCFDEDVLPLLEKGLNSYNSGYKFMVLHLGGGSHGPNYEHRIPAEFKKFNPMCVEADVVNHCTKEELYNSYDNTILYVDFVLGEIINKLDSSELPYVMIYISDHGESLLENGRIFHGLPPGMTLPPEQAQVPLIVKSSIPISIEERDEYTQQDIYNTVLNLLSIETDILDKERVFIKKQN